MPVHPHGKGASQTVDLAFNYDPRQDDFDLSEAIRDLRNINCAFRAHFGNLAVMYELYYTTLFMWPQGPVFSPAFLEKYIFSRYEWIMEPVFLAGKKLVFVSDGNIDVLLERLLEFPMAGIMYENPATPFERVLQTWGKAGRGFIGGISTAILTNGTPEEVSRHTREVIERAREFPGFIISSCGGLPGTIPLENMLAYIYTRNELGCFADL